MKLANRERIPVTPRGAGSGLSGGAVPVRGGIVLLCDRMNRILEIDRDNMMVVVEPGVVTNEINEVLKEYGLFYAGYPMSLETCFIGGNVAENAGGGKAVKYGVTARYVLGLEVVTPTGRDRPARRQARQGRHRLQPHRAHGRLRGHAGRSSPRSSSSSCRCPRRAWTCWSSSRRRRRPSPRSSRGS